MSPLTRRRKRRSRATALTAAAAAPPPAPAGIDRSAVGFWVGGLGLGVAGCVVGACLPYRHPVAVLCSALWWGVFLGCGGGSIVSLGCWLTQRQQPAEGPKKRTSAGCAAAAPAALP